LHPSALKTNTESLQVVFFNHLDEVIIIGFPILIDHITSISCWQFSPSRETIEITSTYRMITKMDSSLSWIHQLREVACEG
jgi:hypothetical protein